MEIENLALVTALYDLDSFEIRSRSTANYLETGSSLLGVDLPKWVFAPAHLHAPIEQSCPPRSRGGLHLVDLAFESLPKYQDLEVLAQGRCFPEVSPLKDTAGYAVLTNSKFDFLEIALELAPTMHHFAWVDFGIDRVAAVQDCFAASLQRAVRPDRVIGGQLWVPPAGSFSESRTERWQTWRSVIAGGVLLGDRSALRKLIGCANDIYKEARDAGWMILDEQVLREVWLDDPGLFDLYLADHGDLIVNLGRHNRASPAVVNALQTLLGLGHYRRVASTAKELVDAWISGAQDRRNVEPLTVLVSILQQALAHTDPTAAVEADHFLGALQGSVSSCGDSDRN